MTSPESLVSNPDGASNRPPAAAGLKGIGTTVRQPQASAEPGKVVLDVTGLNAYFGAQHAVRDVTIAFRQREVTAIIGPSGCGKSTLLRCLNRMHETVPAARATGRIEFHGQDLYGPGVNPIAVRRHIGMVFQRPTPFPTLNIRDNVAAGFRVLSRRMRPSRTEIDQKVEEALKAAALWDEVKDRLKTGAIGLSGGQQQRLCIARALANEPSVILLDEPTASLDPLSTQKIEELVYALRERFTVIIVTHNMQQAARVSDRTAFMLNGELVEVAPNRKAVHHAVRSTHRSLRDRAVWMSGEILSEQFSFWYGDTQALKNISITLPAGQITALIGPSGCGKSTFLRSINRLQEIIPHTRHEGVIRLDGQDVHAVGMDVVSLRRRVGHGIPAVESISEVDLRQRGLWAARQRASQRCQAG